MIENSWQALLLLIAVEAVLGLLVFWIGFVKGGRRATTRHEESVSDHLRRSRQTLGGQFAEQLANMQQQLDEKMKLRDRTSKNEANRKRDSKA